MADIGINSKKGKKKINLDAPLMPGRHYCQCHAQVHNLVNNCLICGRIVCEQEGPGSCFFCGNEVLGKGQRAEFGQNEEEFPEFQDPNSEINKAIQHKNKMIEFDKSNFIQKNVFDEQTDWYSIADDVWQDKKVRQQATEQIAARQEEKEENDRYIHVQYDVSQKKWIENKPIFDEEGFKKKAQEFQNEADQEKNRSSGSENSDDESDDETRAKSKNRKIVKASASTSLKQDQQNLYDQIKEELTLVRVQSEKQKQEAAPTKQSKDKTTANTKLVRQVSTNAQNKLAKIVKTDEFEEFQREIQAIINQEKDQAESQALSTALDGKTIYDDEIYNMQIDDEGKCLSMLQPWASLLVEGFKRFEGRYWTSDYKGPLYIHAGATLPTQQQIDEIENQYKEHYKGVKNMPSLPKRYPTGCLIGCVDLQGVLTREEYIASIPEKYREDSQCEFIFVVRNPRRLFYPIKMKGSKNIFDIPNDIRINCKNQLIKVPSAWFEWTAKDIDIDEIQGKNLPEEVQEEVQVPQVSEQEKFQTNYPALGEKPTRKASEDIASLTLKKKRSNQKKDFMNQDEIHTKLKKMASEIKIKMEGFGFMLAPFLNKQQQTEIAQFIFSKSSGSYKIGMQNLESLVLDVSFPHLDKIVEFATKSFCYFTEGKKSDCLNQMKCVEYFYLNQKQKRFTFDQEYFLILLLGCNYEIVVQNNQTYKTKQIPVDSASILMQLYDEHISIIYEQPVLASKNQIKDLGIKDTLTQLVLCFKHK